MDVWKLSWKGSRGVKGMGITGVCGTSPGPPCYDDDPENKYRQRKAIVLYQSLTLAPLLLKVAESRHIEYDNPN